MRVLHVLGSGLDEYMFKVSWLYGKNCPLDILNDAALQYDYAILVPPYEKQLFFDDQELQNYSICKVEPKNCATWYFVDGSSLDCTNLLPLDGINENQFLFSNISPCGVRVSRKRHPNLPKCIMGPLTLGQLVTLVEQRPRYDLHLPQCMDFQGMTTMRNLFENMLGIPHPGPNGMANFLAQNKALTKSILQNVPGVKIPKGELLYKSENQGKKQGNNFNGHCNHAYSTYQYPSIPLPFMVKPTKEDNSRGVSLCEKPEDIMPAVELAFQYGDCIMVEEFIPGRELRAACIEDLNGTPTVLSCKVEFILSTKIRRTEDKLMERLGEGEYKQDSHLVPTKYDREYLIPGVDTQKVPPMSEDTLDKIDNAVFSAHRALGCRDFSLFDFRVHELTGDPYILESCSFWTFTPISFISGLLDRSKEFFEDGDKQDDDQPHLQIGCWRKVAKTIWEKTAARKPLSKL